VCEPSSPPDTLAPRCLGDGRDLARASATVGAAACSVNRGGPAPSRGDHLRRDTFLCRATKRYPTEQSISGRWQLGAAKPNQAIPVRAGNATLLRLCPGTVSFCATSCVTAGRLRTADLISVNCPARPLRPRAPFISSIHRRIVRVSVPRSSTPLELVSRAAGNSISSSVYSDLSLRLNPGSSGAVRVFPVGALSSTRHRPARLLSDVR